MRSRPGCPCRTIGPRSAADLEAVDVCWEQKRSQVRESELDAARAAYEHARETYRKILAESGGR